MFFAELRLVKPKRLKAFNSPTPTFAKFFDAIVFGADDIMAAEAKRRRTHFSGFMRNIICKS
jgi:hypothetical protein